MPKRRSAKLARQKISTTVAPGTLSYLEALVARGEVQTLAEAIDALVQRVLAMESRQRLERDTAAYFEGLSPRAAEEEIMLGAALAGNARGLDVDREP
jgi:hypothetical protein